MADAAVSKTVVERRASSTLASGTILNLKSRLLRKSAFSFLRVLFKSLRLGANKGLRLGANSASAALPFSKGGNQLPFEAGFF